MLEGSEEPPVEEESDFDIRTRALTRPVYQETVKPTGTSARLTTEDGEDVFAATRESPLQAGVYARYEMSVENAERAAEARAARQQRAQVREEMARQQQEETQERRNRGREVLKRTGIARRNLVTRNLEKGALVREERAEINLILEERVEEIKENHQALLRATGGAVGIDARLDAQEEAAAVALRQEAQAERLARREALYAKKQEMSETNRAAVEALRMEKAARLAHALTSRDRRKAASAKQLRVDSQQKVERLAAEKEEHRLKGREIHERIRRERAEQKQRLEERKQQKIKVCSQGEPERGCPFDAQLLANHEEFLRESREKRDAVFRSKYVSRDAAARFDVSTFRKLHSMDDKAEKEIAAANADILERIENVQQRTDDLLDDEAAGQMRDTFLAASEERRAREQQEILSANAAHRARLRSVAPIVDDLLDDEAAGEKRVELAEASKARRQAELEKTRQRYEEFRQRIESVEAVTDDYMGDEIAGEARAKLAEASAERRRAEAERIAHENEELEKRLKGTKARTDDDVLDEAAGAARSKLAAQSRAQRKAAAQQIAKANQDNRARLKTVKATIDDDIADDPAGKRRVVA